MKRLLLILLLLPATILSAQQVADTSYNPPISEPMYYTGEGPGVFIDEGHHNFHTKDGRYLAFTRLLERDGYVVKNYEGLFEKSSLSKGKIMVISNALNEQNTGAWYLPTPSAFTPEEIVTLNQWVKDGGSLILIADHMPFAGAAQDLAASFGFGFTNGFVDDTTGQGPIYFRREDGTLPKNVITEGRSPVEKVGEAVSFTGQGFTIPEAAIPILVFNDRCINLLPDTAWVFNENTPVTSAAGMSQGAAMKYGKGRVVVFGEAAMFSAQLAGPNRFRAGMNSDFAPENYKLLLNIIHWLDGKLDH